MAMKFLAILFGLVVLLASCGQSDSVVEPGPDDTETTSTTEAIDDDEIDSDEVVTNDESTTSTSVQTSDDDGAGEDPNGDGGETEGDGTTEPPEDVFVLDEDSANAAAFRELADSGLELSLEEQACADSAAAESVAGGATEQNALVTAVQECASPSALDDFSAGLIVAGGAPLPATEAACVSSLLQSGAEFQPFWFALLDEEPFDYLLANNDVQNRYLDLFVDCVSVGRAVADQAGVVLSGGTIGCIDGLYSDREFVRVSIEADLSGNAEDQARVNDQLASCLTDDEGDQLGFS